MSSPPVMSGTIPSDGPAAVLRSIELRATSGVLRFSGPRGAGGEIALRRGEVVEDDDASRSTLERFLDLGAGRFEVIQRLPPLPITRGDEDAREGRLGVHAVVDLLQYCDAAGLTGALFVTSEDRHADFLYDAGELVAVRVFGDSDADVQTALGWEEGNFRIEAWTSMPALPQPSAEEPIELEDLGAVAVDADSEQLLKVVEVTLSSLLEERATRPPPVPEPARARADTRPPRSDATVRVIYLGPPGAARRTKTSPSLSRPELDRAKTEPDLPSEVTLLTRERPFTPATAAFARRPRTASYFGEAGVVASVALALSTLLFLAAIAYPFVLE